jgi:uncharacterized membrane protein YgcG
METVVFKEFTARPQASARTNLTGKSPNAAPAARLIIAAALLSLAPVVLLLAADPAAAAPRAPIGSAAQLPMARTAGGPIKVGDLCWVDTDRSRGFGYFHACDSHSVYARSGSPFDASSHMQAYDRQTHDSGGGGEGGGGGDGGGGGGGSSM